MIRCLASGEEERWLDLVEAAFAQKPTPRSYFERHLRNDPFLTLDTVRVLVDADGNFVSTLRVYSREVLLRGKYYKAGCIGEVSTHPDHRGKGYAKATLNDAMTFMKENGYDIGILKTSTHAAVYAPFGFRHVSSDFIFVENGNLDSSKEHHRYEIRMITEPVDRETAETLCTIYDQFNASYSGIFRRTPEYWQRWIGTSEIVGGQCCMWICYDKTQNNQIVAYFAVNVLHQQELEVSDFGVGKKHLDDDDNDSLQLLNLFMAVVKRDKEWLNIQGLWLPAPVYRKLNHNTKDEERLKSKLGIMYAEITNTKSPVQDEHVFWPIDAY